MPWNWDASGFTVWRPEQRAHKMCSPDGYLRMLPSRTTMLVMEGRASLRGAVAWAARVIAAADEQLRDEILGGSSTVGGRRDRLNHRLGSACRVDGGNWLHPTRR
ncbi:hypothetical protein CBM2598_P280004 [Cupriavidus taiwanensis]|nr:hypothetical protein CBM2598_P280004 [Cupriavidus taiwanensis]